MSGVIEVEGKSPPVIHPQLGTIHMDALARRAMTDFPPVAWFHDADWRSQMPAYSELISSQHRDFRNGDS
jgi:hypothetical protein